VNAAGKVHRGAGLYALNIDIASISGIEAKNAASRFSTERLIDI
jgi:hypothetical protein